MGILVKLLQLNIIKLLFSFVFCILLSIAFCDKGSECVDHIVPFCPEMVYKCEDPIMAKLCPKTCGNCYKSDDVADEINDVADENDDVADENDDVYEEDGDVADESDDVADLPYFDDELADENDDKPGMQW